MGLRAQSYRESSQAWWAKTTIVSVSGLTILDGPSQSVLCDNVVQNATHALASLRLHARFLKRHAVAQGITGTISLWLIADGAPYYLCDEYILLVGLVCAAEGVRLEEFRRGEASDNKSRADRLFAELAAAWLRGLGGATTSRTRAARSGRCRRGGRCWITNAS
jgi:hypothetical protein